MWCSVMKIGPRARQNYYASDNENGMENDVAPMEQQIKSSKSEVLKSVLSNNKRVLNNKGKEYGWLERI